MLRWRLWAGRRDWLALALVGVFVLAVGLSVISMLSDSVRGTVAKEYAAAGPYIAQQRHRLEERQALGLGPLSRKVQ